MSVSVVIDRQAPGLTLVTVGAGQILGRELRASIHDESLTDPATELLLASVEQLVVDRAPDSAPRTCAGSRTVIWTVRGDFLEGIAVGEDGPEQTLESAVRAFGAQRWVSDHFSAPFDPCSDDDLVAMSPRAMQPNVVVEGVRYDESKPDVSGWYITDDGFDGGVNDLVNHHVRHLVTLRPELERFFGLGPGWRFYWRPEGENVYPDDP